MNLKGAKLITLLLVFFYFAMLLAGRDRHAAVTLTVCFAAPILLFATHIFSPSARFVTHKLATVMTE